MPTFHVHRYDKYLKEFWLLYSLWLIIFLVVLAIKIYYIVRLMGSGLCCEARVQAARGSGSG